MQFDFSALASLAVANPARRGEPASSCSTDPIQCCNTVTTAGSLAAASILKSLGVVVEDVNAAVGLTCSPVTVVGVQLVRLHLHSVSTNLNAHSSANAVCCQDNSHGGLISIGCVPVTL